MIRYFIDLCKKILAKYTDETLLENAVTKFSYYEHRCSRCGAIGKLTPYGRYNRYLVSRINNVTSTAIVSIPRYKCSSCRRTHALLPVVLVPYSQYSLRFILEALVAYSERTTSVPMLCMKLGIAVSTLYNWKKVFLHHIKLLQGLLVSKKEPMILSLRKILDNPTLTVYLQDFYLQYSFSFLQIRNTVASRNRPP